MNNFVTIRLFKTFNLVNYYTFWVEGKPQSETDAFFSRFEKEDEVTADLNLLVTWITEIGQHRRAKGRYFRFENDANALPPPARIMAELGDNYCRLRLYWIRLTDEVVILANGGLKTGRSVQESPDLLAKFRFANKMANQLLDLIQSNQLLIQDRTIVNIVEIELVN